MLLSRSNGLDLQVLWIRVAHHKVEITIPDSGDVVGKSSKVLHEVLSRIEPLVIW